MRTYIRNNTGGIHLTDLFDEIVAIVYIDNIKSYTHSIIMASEDDEDFEYDGSEYISYSDKRLLSISEEDMNAITNLDVLDRIRKLDMDLLTDEQIKLLQEEYRTKVIIDRSDVQKILDMLKDCNDFYRVPRGKNIAFEKKHNMKMQDYLDIIHSLEISDYVNNTKSMDRKYLGNDIIVFMPKGEFELERGGTLSDFYIYIKIDLTETDDVIAAISFHDTKKEDYKPYQK